MNEIEITNKWLHEHCSNPSKTAWTSAQLKALGVKWPPVSGWKEDVIGRVIGPETARAFVKGARTFTKRTLKLRRKEAQRILERDWK